MAGSSARTEVYYRWTDADGHVHLVSSLDAVPVAVRPRVERLVMGVPEPPSVAERASAVASSSAGTLLLLGAGVGVVLLVLSRLLPQGLRWLGKLGAFALVAALLGGLYLGALRRSTGASSGDLLASPSAIIDDTKRAVEKMNQRQKLQDEELRRIQSEAH